MNTARILHHNNEKFLEDIKSVRNILVWTEYTESYFEVKKKDVLKLAAQKTIYYSMDEGEIYIAKRLVMIIE